MATLTRQPQKVFAGNANASQIAVMGSMKTGTPDYQTDLDKLQSASYELGWDSALLADKAPYLEEMNGVQYGFSYQIAYILQEGIPEYDKDTNYSLTSIVKIIENNNLILYRSLKDNNKGVADITNSEDWTRLYIVDYGRVGDPQFTLSNTIPNNCVWLDGSPVSRTTYSQLFAIYGTTYGIGDGSTTFNLPNLTNRTIWGANNFGYINAGLPNIKGSFPIDNSSWVAGSVFIDGSNSKGATGENGFQYHARFDASRSSSVYKDSVTTVQPPAIKVKAYTRWQ